MFQIPDPRACKFWFPISEIGLGQTGYRAIRIRMPMPKATIDKDHRSATWENQVRSACHAASMQSEPITKPVHH